MHKSFMAGLLAAAALVPGLATAQSWKDHDRRGNKSEESRPAPHQQARPTTREAPPMPRRDGPVRRFDGNPNRNQWSRPTPTPQPRPANPGTQNRGGTDGWAGRDHNGRPQEGQNRQNWQNRGNAAGWGDRDHDRDHNGRPDTRQNRGDWQNRPQPNNQWRDRDHDGRPGWRDARPNGNEHRGGWTEHRGNWNRDWRHNNQYDWNRYRSQNRYQYRLPRYYAPRGWGYGYRRFGIGTVLSNLLFSSSYWIADPYAYRLPPAYGPYRWVRYYNDALLVDTYSGQVVDVVYDIFW